MDHGWVTVNYNVARCSLIIVPVESSRVGVTTRRRQIKYTYPREGSALVRKKKKTTSLDSPSLVLQVHKDWILARSTTEQAWSAVRPPQIRTPQRACRAHKAFYLSSQVEPSDSALWVKGTTRKQPGTVKLQVGRPITVHFSMPAATHRDFPWSILITALWAAAHRAHRFRLSKIEKTSNSKLSLVNFPFEFFQAVFINRFVCDFSFTWYKKVRNSQKLNSRGGDPALKRGDCGRERNMAMLSKLY